VPPQDRAILTGKHERMKIGRKAEGEVLDND
jgi:hypothetical protein